MIKTIKILLDDIKFQHTIFAMPFAIISLFLASEGLPPLNKLIWVVMAMVSGRTAAMIFNRTVDAEIDSKNPRTINRALPSKKIGEKRYYLFLAISAALFFVSCANLNRTCLYLSPIALFIIFFYSFTKRFTSLSHICLGIALSLSPIGAWIAVREELSAVSIILGLAVICWLAGFDIIYSCQDVEFDKTHNLHSFPQKYGIPRALQLSMSFHTAMIILLFSLTTAPKLGLIYMIGVIFVGILLIYEHSLVAPNDLSKVNIAFFNMNGIISILLMGVVILDVLNN